MGAKRALPLRQGTPGSLQSAGQSRATSPNQAADGWPPEWRGPGAGSWWKKAVEKASVIGAAGQQSGAQRRSGPLSPLQLPSLGGHPSPSPAASTGQSQQTPWRYRHGRPCQGSAGSGRAALTTAVPALQGQAVTGGQGRSCSVCRCRPALRAGSPDDPAGPAGGRPGFAPRPHRLSPPEPVR